jgi:hypothetical protein
LPLQRFLKVKGKPGVPAANPWAQGHNPPRFAGKMRDPALDGEPEFLAKYRDVEEVLADHACLRKACKSGDLLLLGECVADSPEEAAKKMAGEVKAKKEKA